MAQFVIALLLTMAPVPPAAPQGEWTEFRGPTGQGLAESKNLPVEWGPDKNVAWKVAVPGKGWSSPIVAGGRIYMTTAVPKTEEKISDQSLRGLCLDAKTGKTIWDKEIFLQEAATAPKIHSKNSHASATPALDGDRVYFHFGHQGIACLNATSGSVVWTNRELPYKPVHGNGGSPVVYENKVMVMMDGPDRRELVAFDKLTGKVLWEAKRKQPAKRPFSFCTPLVATIAGKVTVVAVGSDVVNGFDPDTGAELWAVTYDGYSIVPRPVFGQGLIFFSTGYDNPVLMAVKVNRVRNDTGYEAKVEWSSKSHAPRNASPVLLGTELYTVSDDGFATCFEAKTGKVIWQERIKGEYSSSILYAAGRLYMQNETGVATVLKAGKEFEEVATNTLSTERVQASYAVDGDALLIRTEKHLYRVAK